MIASTCCFTRSSQDTMLRVQSGGAHIYMTQRQYRRMNIAELLLPFSEAASLSLQKEPAETTLKRVVCSLACNDHRGILTALYSAEKAEALDWHGVGRYLSSCNFGADDWGRLLGLLDFEQEVCAPGDVADLLSNARAGVRVSLQNRTLDPLCSMRLCFAKLNLSPAWDVLCKCLVACNLSDVEVARVLSHVLEPVVAKDLLQHLASCARHTPEQYSQIFSLLLSPKHVNVRAHVVREALRVLEQRQQQQRANIEVAHAAAARTSLTRRLEHLRLSSRAESEQDSFAAFVTHCRLPSGTNPRLVQLLYCLVCLPPGTVSEADLSLLKVPIPTLRVVTPDILALRAFLMGSMHAGALCASLRDFLERCVTGLNKQELSHTTALRLYLATYAAPDLVRGLWDFVLRGHEQTCNEMETTLRSYLQSRPQLALGPLLETLL